MSEFEFENNDNRPDDGQINQDEIEVVDQENNGDSSESSLYHYSGDPYREESTSSRYTYGNSSGQNDSWQEEPRRERYRYQGSSQEQGYYDYTPHEPKKRGFKGDGEMPKKIAKLVGAALIFGIVAGVGFAGVSIAKDKLYPSSADKIETVTVQKGDDSTDSGSGDAATVQNVSNIVDGVMPSVVSITSTVETYGFYGFGAQESEGAGSGFIIAKTDENLMIATNNHVVADAKSLTVGFVDDTTAGATVVGTDTDADLAVISVKLSDLSEDTMSKIKIAVLGDSDKLKVGEAVIAIGNALGYGQSVTTGVISAKNREVSFTDGTMTLLQTDAAINPGNSGGVLVNLNGEVVGINNAKLEDTSVEGMCYAIPISTAQGVLTDLMNAGTIKKDEEAYLGIVGKTIDSSYSQALGMPSGIYVSQVVSGSPAEEAGIAAGDIITAFEGNGVSTMEGLKEKLSIKKAGTKVKLTLKRANQNGEYKEQTVTVTLGKKSDYEDSEEDTTQSTEQNNYYGNGGNRGSDPYSEYFGNGSGNDYYNNPYYYFFN